MRQVFRQLFAYARAKRQKKRAKRRAKSEEEQRNGEAEKKERAPHEKRAVRPSGEKGNEKSEGSSSNCIVICNFVGTNMAQLTSEKRTEALRTAPIGKLLYYYTLPSLVGMVVMSLYNIVDRVFIGQGVGEYAIAG